MLNYDYNNSGNLSEDKSEQLKIHWTYYNKLRQVDSANSTKLKFRYDALGNRVVKDIVNKSKEIYVRDVQGNVIVLYEIKNDSLMSKEYYIYGVNRLGYMEDKAYMGKKMSGKTIGGVIAMPNAMPALPNPFVFAGTTSVVPVYFGGKRYELSDWLGNVRVVVSDRKMPVNTGSVTVSYMPQVVSVRDYYSFGFEMNERTYSQSKYRFSFNGKEDIEQRWYQDYGARYYNKALGRFISADPLIVQQKKYPWLSSYQFAGNTPVQAIDMDGLEARKQTIKQEDGKSLIKITIDLKVKNSAGLPESVVYGYAFEIAKQVEMSFSKEAGDVIYKTEVNLNFDDIPKHGKDFYIDFRTKLIGKNIKPWTTGATDELGNTNINRFQIKIDDERKNDLQSIARTGAHEIGHGMGLTHTNPMKKEYTNAPEDARKDEKNLMRTRDKDMRYKTNITPSQLKQIEKKLKDKR